MRPTLQVIALLLTAPVWVLLAGPARAQIDTQATANTQALYNNLLAWRTDGLMKIAFGHHHSTYRGVGWTQSGQPDSTQDDSDVKRTTGQFPAVYGWTIVGRDWESSNFPRLIKNAYQRGGINTIHWQAPNLKTGGNHNDITKVVPDLLPGGSMHGSYKNLLDRIAVLFNQCKFPNGVAVPLIFRPYHEMNYNDNNGNPIYWWSNCTKDEYKQLWQFTVEYLRDTKGIHHVIYAYAPSGNPRFTGLVDTQAEYFAWYPGDDYVDVIGMDRYYEANVSSLQANLKVIADIAYNRNKIAAFTEIGYPGGLQNGSGYPNWWMTSVHDALKDDPNNKGDDLSYILTWTNGSAGYYFVPYPNSQQEQSFINFYNTNRFLFENDLPNMYQ